MKWLPLFAILLSLSPGANAIGYERFEEHGKVGIKNDQGQVILPASFDALGWSDGSFSVAGEITGYRQGNRWGLLNLNKKFITKATYLSLTLPGGNRVLVGREINSYTSKFGCIDLAGEMVVPLVYDAITVHDLRAIVMQKNGPRYNYGLIDLNNRIILPVIYQRITPLGTLRYAVQNFSNKTAVCSEEGKWSTGFDIDSVSVFQFDLAIVYKNLHQGVIDRFGQIRVDPIYREIRISEPGSAQMRKPDLWRVIDLQQKELHRIEADELESLGHNRNRATLSGKVGLVDSLFNTVLPLAYDYIGKVDHEKVVVKKNGKFGLLRTNQTVILPITFDSLILQGHLIRARWNDQGQIKWDLYDTVGVKKTETSYEQMGPFTDHIFPVVKRGYAGGIDRLGKEVIACVYDSLGESDDEHMVIKFRGQYGIITLSDQWKVPPQRNRIHLLPGYLLMERHGNLNVIKDFSGKIIYFTEHPLSSFPDHLLEKLQDGTEKEINFQGQIVNRKIAVIGQGQQFFREHEGLTVVKRDGKYGFVDSRGRLRIANRYEDADNFHEGRASIQLLGKWGFIDKHDEIVVQPTYDRVTRFHLGVAWVTRNQKEGLIDSMGSVLLELRYDSIQPLADGSFVLISQGMKGLANPRGKVLIEPRFERLELTDAHHVIVRQNGLYGVLTRDGLSVIPLVYDNLIYQKDTHTFFVHQSFGWEQH